MRKLHWQQAPLLGQVAKCSAWRGCVPWRLHSVRTPRMTLVQTTLLLTTLVGTRCTMQLRTLERAGSVDWLFAEERAGKCWL
jgi:hypothetical protein